MRSIASLCIAAAMLAGTLALPACSTIPSVGAGGVDLVDVADRIGAERNAQGELTQDGALVVNAAVLLAVTEAASYRALEPGQRAILAARLESAGAALLLAAEGDGWFVEADAQEAIDVAAAVIGEAAINRALRIALSGPSIDGAQELAASGLIVTNTAAGVRRVNQAYLSGEISRDEAIAILRARVEQALGRLRP